MVDDCGIQICIIINQCFLLLEKNTKKVQLRRTNGFPVEYKSGVRSCTKQS